MSRPPENDTMNDKWHHNNNIIKFRLKNKPIRFQRKPTNQLSWQKMMYVLFIVKVGQASDTTILWEKQAEVYRWKGLWLMIVRWYDDKELYNRPSAGTWALPTLVLRCILDLIIVRLLATLALPLQVLICRKLISDWLAIFLRRTWLVCPWSGSVPTSHWLSVSFGLRIVGKIALSRD